MTTINPERIARLDSLTLARGSHPANGNGVPPVGCAMEVVAWMADEPWSDRPACVSPVIGAFMRSWNDALDDESRQMLKSLLPLTVGTATGKRDEEKRAWMATDWLARECAPAFLRLAGLTEHAETLENLAALTTAKRASSAQPKLAAARDAARAARDAANAARAAAGDAAWAAAWDAAWDAAGDAAWDAAANAARAAAGDAARAAAGAAARDAAWAAAWDAAGDALEPTVKTLQTSAYQLVERMCAVGRV